MDTGMYSADRPVVLLQQKSLRSKEVRFNSYLDTVVRNIERTNHHAVQNLDIGMAVFAKDGKLQWKNELFSKYVGTKNLEANVRKMFCRCRPMRSTR